MSWSSNQLGETADRDSRDLERFGEGDRPATLAAAEAASRSLCSCMSTRTVLSRGEWQRPSTSATAAMASPRSTGSIVAKSSSFSHGSSIINLNR